MKIKLYRTTPVGPIYNISDPSRINQKLIDSIDWPKDSPYRNFTFKQAKLNPITPLRFNVSSKYNQMLSCFSPRAGIKIPTIPAIQPAIEARSPKNLPELFRLSRAAHKMHLINSGKRAGISARKDYDFYESTYLPKAKALLFFKNKKFIGLIVHFKRTGLFGDKQDYIAWHDRFMGLSPKEVKTAQYHLALWLNKTAKRRISIFLTPGKNQMYKFCGELGFVTSRVLFEKLPD